MAGEAGNALGDVIVVEAAALRVPAPAQQRNKRRMTTMSRTVEKTTSNVVNTKILRTCGSPAAGSGESAREIRVPNRNRLSGSQMRGSRMRPPESNRAASASPKRICDAAMEKIMATAEPNVSQRAMRKRSGSDESMNIFSIALCALWLAVGGWWLVVVSPAR